MPAIDLSRQNKVPALTSVDDRTKHASGKDILVLSSDDEDSNDDDVSVVCCGTQRLEGAALAAHMESIEAHQREERKHNELKWMKESHAGRSVLLVERIIQLIDKHKNAGVEPVGKDDAVFLAELMFQQQEKFKSTAKTPSHVSIGYHYTQSESLGTIRTDGLLTVEDRVAAKKGSSRNNAYFGNGIYTGTSKSRHLLRMFATYNSGASPIFFDFSLDQQNSQIQ